MSTPRLLRHPLCKLPLILYATLTLTQRSGIDPHQCPVADKRDKLPHFDVQTRVIAIDNSQTATRRSNYDALIEAPNELPLSSEPMRSLSCTPVN